ncbi:MAG: hypothetical protein BMS9Abin34_338 [Patescibacteria group bacterium]|nr:MAG: hypothetical protein BMS9Abin34_338 [Patescibacteria group bacterium]
MACAKMEAPSSGKFFLFKVKRRRGFKPHQAISFLNKVLGSDLLWLVGTTADRCLWH